MSRTSSLEVAGLRVTLGSRPVLAGVDATLPIPGSVALVGPSGSGKTTLLAAIAGLLSPDAGVVRWRGTALDARSIAWIMQTTPLLGARSALGNVMLGGLARGLRHREAAELAWDAAARLGLEALLAVPVRRLSGGERQRVAVARALVQEAPVVLADEPTASLDAASRDRVVEALLAVEAAGRLVVVATHDEAVAERCSHRIVLVDGRVG